MALHITPEMLEGAYALLRATPPFRGWKLPPSDEVEFRVSRTRKCSGLYEYLGMAGAHRIHVSCLNHSQLSSLLVTMAHEMVHLAQQLRYPKAPAGHGKLFNRMADQVCRYHGIDRATF